MIINANCFGISFVSRTWNSNVGKHKFPIMLVDVYSSEFDDFNDKQAQVYFYNSVLS